MIKYIPRFDVNIPLAQRTKEGWSLRQVILTDDECNRSSARPARIESRRKAAYYGKRLAAWWGTYRPMLEVRQRCADDLDIWCSGTRSGNQVQAQANGSVSYSTDS